MEQENPKYHTTHSVKGLMLDYINFIFVLILGFIFNWESSDITSLFLMQIALLIIFLAFFAGYNLCKGLLWGEKTASSHAFDFCVFRTCVLFMHGIYIGETTRNNIKGKDRVFFGAERNNNKSW